MGQFRLAQKGDYMWLNIKTGYTFKQVYGPLDKIAEKCKLLCDYYNIPRPYGGIADIGNTFAHIPWSKACKSAGIKPIYGVVLPVTEDLQREVRRYPFNLMTFIAKNTIGLKEIYDLVELSFDQFYYKQRITYEQVNNTSKDVIITSGISPNYSLINREVLKEIGPQIPLSVKKKLKYENGLIPVIDNFYVNAEDDFIYEPFADERLRERRTYPIHILSFDEWANESKFFSSLLPRIQAIADSCDVQLLSAPMVRYIGKDDIEKWCEEGAVKRKIDITSEGEYKKRYKREMMLIKEKDYVDYFLVVADSIRYAKTKMAVGPARGSAAGSLVCYLMGITEVNPLEYDLYFERFIDVNRFDLPDIDIDFQRNKRHLVVKYLEKKYGKDNVVQIGNINRMKPKSAITRYAQAMGIPIDEVIELKDAIMERSGGDARANACIEDTFNDTEVGKKFLDNYPNMEVVKHIEAHPSHTGVHAAGILVCNHAITNYCGVNSRDNKRIGMLDKKDAEEVNLLKIDALGLRTLDIIADVCDSINKPYEWMYEIPVDDEKTFDIFNKHRFNGIFQFEGPAVQGLAKAMPIEDMEDIAALGALGRPGPLVSGGATSFLEYRNNPKKIKYLSDHPVVIEATKGTYGIIIYQEQMLAIGRNYGKLSWKDTGDLRKAASKSLGDEFFDKFKVKFLEGAKSIGEEEENALKVWKAMHTFGSWCLSGNTILRNPFTNQLGKKEITIKELYENNGHIVKKSACGNKLKKQKLFCMIEGDVIKPMPLNDICCSGMKTTYLMKLDSGEEIRSTLKHKFYTGEEWKKLEELSVGDSIAVMGKKRRGTKNKPYKGTGSGAHNKRTGESIKFNDNLKLLQSTVKKCRECGIAPYEETHHIDCNKLNNELSNLLPVCRKCHKRIHVELDGENACIPHKVGNQIKLSKIIYIGEPKEEMTYDISMPYPYNNFVANNIVCHNSFNKSHAISYAIISYICAYLKAHYPMEFLIANLKNSKDEKSALKILRDAVENDGIKYVFFDEEKSEADWAVKEGVLYGGFSNLFGIGKIMANKAVKLRREGKLYPLGLANKIKNKISPFKYLYPAKEIYGDYYNDPMSHNIYREVSKIIDIKEDGEFVLIGCMVKKNLRDANEACFVNKRGGKFLTGNTAWLNIILEDDTGSIMCKIKKEDYELFGRDIAEKGKENKDWYAVFGEKINGWSILFVKNIMNITRNK